MKIKFLRDMKVRNLSFKKDSVFEGINGETIIDLNDAIISIVISDIRYDIKKDDIEIQHTCQI